MLINSWKRTVLIGLVAALSWPLVLPAQAAESLPDTIVLKDGSSIRGTVTSSRDGLVTIETDFAGAIKVALDKIESMQTRDPVVIQLADETVLPGQPLQVVDEQLVLAGDQGLERRYAINELRLLNPEPWELGHGYRWSGTASAALESERGNTDTDELDFQLESVWRSKRDRYTFKFSGENSEADGVKDAENWLVRGKYDYFLGGGNYWGVRVSAEHDKFTDLDLRYLVGPFIGRQFYEQPIFSLAAEVGVAYVDEDFVLAEDQDYAAANWEVTASSNYLGGNSLLYLDNSGIWSLDDTSNVIVDTTLGLSFPLMWSLEAAAEILLEYDSGAVEGVDELDQTYRFRIGYSW